MLLSLLLALAMQAPPVKTATVRGRVLSADGNTGVHYAVVRVQQNGNSGGATQSVMADAGGAYEFKNVEPGTYFIQAGKANYITKSFAFPDGSSDVKLAAGQVLGDADIRLTRSCVISGIILNLEGEPVAGVNVQAVGKFYPQGKVAYRNQHGTSTDDHGEFRLFGLQPGRYYVRATRAGGPRFGGPATEIFLSAIYPAVSRIEDAQPIRVAAGEERKGVNMTLRETQTFVLNGKLIHRESGQPVVNGNISATPGESGAGQNVNVQTKPDGSFSLRGLAAGTYFLRINAGAAAGGTPVNLVKPIEVRADINDLTVVATPGVSVKGKVVAAGGDLPEKLNVSLRNLAGAQTGAVNAATTPDGSFELKKVQPGTYEVNVNQMGNARKEFFVGGIKAGDRDILYTGLTVTEDGAPDFTLTMDFRPGEVSGRVLDPEGKPLRNTQLALFTVDPSKRSQRTWRNTRSEADGKFRLFNLPPGEYYLLTWPNDDIGLALDPEVFGMVEKQMIKVTIDRSAKVTQDLVLTKELRTLAEAFSQ